MSPHALINVVAGFVLVISVVQATGVARVVQRASRTDAPALDQDVREFKCGFRGRLPSPISASYPLARLAIAREFLLLRSAPIGDFVFWRVDGYRIEIYGKGLAFSKLRIGGRRASVVIFVANGDVADVSDQLAEHSWFS